MNDVIVDLSRRVREELIERYGGICTAKYASLFRLTGATFGAASQISLTLPPSAPTRQPRKANVPVFDSDNSGVIQSSAVKPRNQMANRGHL
jgi:hypothetical protein